MPSRHGSRFFHHESPRAFGRAPGVPHRPADAFWHHLDVHRFVVAGGKAGHRSYGGSAARRPYCAGIAAKIKPAEKPTADDTDLKRVGQPLVVLQVNSRTSAGNSYH